MPSKCDFTLQPLDICGFFVQVSNLSEPGPNTRHPKNQPWFLLVSSIDSGHKHIFYHTPMLVPHALKIANSIPNHSIIISPLFGLNSFSPLECL